MSLLPSQVTPPTPVIEIRLGDTWVDVSDRLVSQTISITRGSQDETSRGQPMTTSFTLDNRSGEFTPGNPLSPHWPHIDMGAACRITYPAHEPDDRGTLALNGPDDAAWTPAVPALEIPGDLEVSVDVSGDLRATTGGGTVTGWALMSRWQPAGGQEAWVLWTPSGGARLSWMTSGGVQRSASSPVLPDAGRLAIRARLSVATPTVTWDLAPTIDGPWEQFGDPVVVTGGATDIRASTARLLLGNVDAQQASGPFPGRIHAAEVRDGIGGTVVAAPDMRGLARDTDAWTDAAGRDWQLDGGAAVTVPCRFIGRVAEWVPEWPYGDSSGAASPGESFVRVTAAGVLRQLGQGAKPLRSTLYRRVTAAPMAPNVKAYWPMEDGSDAGRFASPIPGVAPMEFAGELRPASDDSLASSEPLPSVAGGQPAGWVAHIPTFAHADTWRVEMFVRVPTGPSSLLPLAIISTTGDFRQWVIAVSSSAIVVQGWAAANETATPTFEHGAAPSFFFDDWVRVSLRARLDGGALVYDFLWVVVGGFAVGWTEGPLLSGQTGRPRRVANIFASAPPDGLSIGHLIVSTGLRNQWLSNPGTFTGGADAAFNGERAQVRFARLCSEEGILAQVLGGVGSSTRMGPQGTRSLPELLQECATADFGVVSEALDAEGLRFRPGWGLYNQAPVLDLDAAAGGVGDITHPFEPTLDDQSVRNDVAVTRDGGSSSRVADQAHIDGHGRYDEDATVSLASDSQTVDQAGWRLHLGTWQGMRYRSVSTELTVAPHQIGPWLDVDLGDRALVRHLPPQHPTDAVDVLVRQVTEQVSPTRWTMAAALTPAGPWDVGTLDGDGIPDVSLARVDTDGSVLADPLTSTGTTFDVDVTGTRWVSDDDPDGWGESDYFPFDLLVGGERMTVTGVTGTASPQTFTVTRAVNGVVKGHPAGTPVLLAHPIRAAL